MTSKGNYQPDEDALMEDISIASSSSKVRMREEEGAKKTSDSAPSIVTPTKKQRTASAEGPSFTKATLSPCLALE